eukprot:scaffold356035_cov34-Prasinocladus_malaysianus.AAC.2
MGYEYRSRSTYRDDERRADIKLQYRYEYGPLSSSRSNIRSIEVIQARLGFLRLHACWGDRATTA